MEEDIRQHLEEQKKLLKSIQRAARFSAAINTLRFLVVVIPFILAVVYVPRLISEYQQSFQDSLMGDSIRLPQGFEIGDLQQYLERN